MTRGGHYAVTRGGHYAVTRGGLLLAVAVATAVAAAGIGCTKKDAVETSKAEVSTSAQKMSYAIGYENGRSLRARSLVVEEAAYLRGLREGRAGASELTPDILAAGQAETLKSTNMNAGREMAERKLVADKFLKANLNEAGVREIEPGLQYKVLREGSGANIGMIESKAGTSADIKVLLKRTSRTMSGETFETFPAPGTTPTPIRLVDQLTSVQKVLRTVSAGSVIEIYLSPEKAFGEKTPPGVLPLSGVIMEIEVYSVNEK